MKKKILHKAYDNVFNNINDGKGGLKKEIFHVQRNDITRKYSSGNLDKEMNIDNTKETIKNQINPGEIDITAKRQKNTEEYFSGNLDKEMNIDNTKETIKNQTNSSEINITRENQKNKVGFCQHCLFGLFFILMCFSLFLCFKISLYFLVLFFISLIICSCLGFKNYCSCCRCSKNIEAPLIGDGKDISSKSQSVDNNLVKIEKTVKNRGH